MYTNFLQNIFRNLINWERKGNFKFELSEIGYTRRECYGEQFDVEIQLKE